MNLHEKMKENEIYSSVENTLTERFSSSMYGTFTIAWFLWNWRAIYTTIFVDQDLIFSTFKQLKIDYIWATYYNGGFWHDITLLLLGPIISVALALWVLSYAEFWCYKKACSNKNRQERERIRQSKEIEDEKKEVLEVKESNVIKENEIKKEMTEEEIWEEEYKKLEQKDGFMDTLEALQDGMYKHGGDLYRSEEWEKPLGSQRVAFLEANNLIEKTGRQIVLTQKGKFFLKKFFEEEDAKI